MEKKREEKNPHQKSGMAHKGSEMRNNPTLQPDKQKVAPSEAGESGREIGVGSPEATCKDKERTETSRVQSPPGLFISLRRSPLPAGGYLGNVGETKQ